MRRPPHNASAEKALLGAVFVQGHEALDLAREVLQLEDLYIPAHQTVWRAMCELRDRGAVIDTVTVETQLAATGELKIAGGLQVLSQLADNGSSRPVRYHVELIRLASLRRRMVTTCQTLAEEGVGPVEDVEAWVAAAEQRVLDVATLGRSDRARSGKDLADESLDALERRTESKDPLTGVGTRFYQLDKMTAGLQPGDMIVVGARPSMGKTSLVLNLVEDAAIRTRGRPVQPVLFFSLEMSPRALTDRLICSMGRIDSNRFRLGTLQDEEWAATTRATAELARAPIFVDHARSIVELKTKARRFRSRRLFGEGQHGMIVLDYFQLLRGVVGRRHQNQEQELAEISRGLKEMALELQLPVLVVSQLNRELERREDKRPQLGDLRGSGALEQDADVVMFLFREERYLLHDAKKREEVKHKAELIVAKQRNGPIGTVHLTFFPELTRFENAA